MQVNINAEKINDSRIIPSAFWTILLMSFLFFISNQIKIPLVKEKPSEEIMMTFIEEEEPEPEKKENKEDKKKEPEKVDIEKEIKEIPPDELISEEDLVFEPQQIEVMESMPSIQAEMQNEMVKTMMNLPGNAGMTDFMNELSMDNPAITAGIDMGGDLGGFDNNALKLNINTTSENYNLGVVQKKRRQVGEGRRNQGPNVNLRPKDYISPIIKWMERNPYNFSSILKSQMEWTSGNLTSRAKISVSGKTYWIYLLCNKALPQLSILIADFTNNKETFTLIKDAGMLQKPGYLMEGIFIPSGSGDDFAVFDGQQKSASQASAKKFNDIFWTWFDKVNK